MIIGWSPYILLLIVAQQSSAMSSPMKLRVVSYNVLSSHLASASHYPTYNPDHLIAANRLPVVLGKLKDEMATDKNVVLCLQEVSYDWAGSLHAFFAQNNYHLVTGLYGKPFNGYMGVCLAWPNSRFDAVDVDISRIADHREGGWPKDPAPSLPSRTWSKTKNLLGKPLQWLGYNVDEQRDHWKMSQRRFNVMVSAKLQEKNSGQIFSISTYHMPCAFYAPMVMTIHCDLAARHAQRFAGESPCILAGDFNIKPCDPTYELLTTGEIDKESSFYPAPKSGMEWQPNSDSMLSAYATRLGSEPDFTNYARAREDEPFIDTLDYIFVDKKNWEVEDVLPLKHRDESGGPLPNLDVGEPSDHVVIAADLIIARST